MDYQTKSIKGAVLEFDVSARTLSIPTANLEGKCSRPAPAYKAIKDEFGDCWVCILTVGNDKHAVAITKTDGENLRELYDAETRKRIDAEAAALSAAIPGLARLQAASEDEGRYFEQFNVMMENEHNDGVNPPVPVKQDYDTLACQYPRAALYLRAEGYTYASHYAKSTAGDKAKKILASGGSIDAAAEALDNWLPTNAANY